MTYSERKLDLITWLILLDNNEIIKKIEAIRKEQVDWWDSISDFEKKEIDTGLDDLKKGKRKNYQEVRENFKQWL
jgi:hypothetical protein